MRYDAIIIGAGASGLTAAAYLAREGNSTMLLEKQPRCGGLIGTFTRDGFTFDGGVRAFDNAGVLFPMLKQLGLNIEFVKNQVSLGIEDQVIEIESDANLDDYQVLLNRLYPESIDEIALLVEDIHKIMRYMDIQYGINNPLFLDVKEDRDYFLKAVVPWMFKYALTAPKVSALNQPVIPYLKKFTNNKALIDIISQHFFTDTPAYFALSYFKLYQDYFYPKGGTGVLIDKLTEFIQAHGGEIRTSMGVTAIDLETRTVRTSTGDTFDYQQLLWTADQKMLYQIVDLDALADSATRVAVTERRALLSDKAGNDSVLTLFLGSNLDPGYFKAISNAHFFYTPSRLGQSLAGSPPIDGSWEQIDQWLKKFYAYTTYEISIPALRDPSLVPTGKTGLIISTLFDYRLTEHIYENGWEDRFQNAVGNLMIENLERTVYPGLAESVLQRSTSTPITLQRLTGSTDGAITGWAFTNQPMPAESRLVKIANSVKTPLPNVTQAGQWTYSPSGLPVSFITGKVAADSIHKRLKRAKRT